MITMTYDRTGNQAFLQAAQKLAQIPMNARTSYRVMKILDAVQRGRKSIMAEFEALMAQYGEYKDGEFKPHAGKEEEFKKATAEFDKKELKIDRERLAFAEIERLELTASDLSVLEDIYEEPPVAEVVSISG